MEATQPLGEPGAAERHTDGTWTADTGAGTGSGPQAAHVPRAASAKRLAGDLLQELRASSERAKRKVSVTVDAELWDEVSGLVERDAAASASAAVEMGLVQWVASQRLWELLDELYREAPDTRPAEEDVGAAAELLGFS